MVNIQPPTTRRHPEFTAALSRRRFWHSQFWMLLVVFAVCMATGADVFAGNRFSDCGGVGQPICNKILAFDRGPSKALGCPGKNNYKSGKSCYVCPAGYKRTSLNKKMHTQGACKSIKKKAVYKKAKYNGKAKLRICKGKRNYLSGKSCYICPAGYKRTSRKTSMTSSRACVRKYRPVANARRGSQTAACPGGQFKHKGRCLQCPNGTKRIGIAGIDSRSCKVERQKVVGARDAKWCDAGLRLAKLAPARNFDRLRNLAGSKKNKMCARPFDLKRAALADIPGVGAKMPRLVVNFAQELLKGSGKGKLKQLRRDLKRKNFRAAYNTLLSLPPFRAIAESARERRHQTITIGLTGEASLGVGYGFESGIAVDLARKRVSGYKTTTFSKGFSYGGSGGVTVGFSNGGMSQVAYAQGFASSFSKARLSQAVAGAVSPVDMTIAVWYTYYQPRRQEQFLGYSITYSVGQGETYLQYAETKTTRL